MNAATHHMKREYHMSQHLVEEPESTRIWHRKQQLKRQRSSIILEFTKDAWTKYNAQVSPKKNQVDMN